MPESGEMPDRQPDPQPPTTVDGRPLSAPPAPGEGRVWRRPGAPRREPAPAAAPRDGGPGGPGAVRFLVLAAAAVALFVAGAALGGPLGLVPADAPAEESVAAPAAPLLGGLTDLLELPGQLTASLTDAAGEPAGAVILAPGSGRLALVTRAELPAAPPLLVVLERGGVRTPIGPLTAAPDPADGSTVRWWIGALPEGLPVDTGLVGDRILVLAEGDVGGTPFLAASF